MFTAYNQSGDLFSFNSFGSSSGQLDLNMLSCLISGGSK